MKGVIAVAVVFAAALLVSISGGVADAGIVGLSGTSTQIAGAVTGMPDALQAVNLLAAVRGQTSYSWDTSDDDDDSDRSNFRQVNAQAFSSIIEIIRLLTGPENWGEVKVITRTSTTQDEYTTTW